MPDFSNHPLRKRYNLDTAMSTIWEFYKKWFLPLFIISFISSLITSTIASKIDLSELQTIEDPMLMIEAIKPFTGSYLLIVLIGIIFSVLLQYFIISKPVDSEDSATEWIVRAFTRFLLPMLLVYLVLSVMAVFAIFLGLLALIVGAFFAIFYVMIFFTLAAPVMMIEDISFVETISRTLSLGHKKFGINLGWVTLFLILVLIISIVLSAIIMIPFTGGFIKSIVNPDSAGDIIEFSRKPAYILLSSLASALTAPLYPIFSLVLYFNVRSYEESDSSVFSDDNNGDNGVTVEDLYASPNRKEDKRKIKKGEERRPTVEDLAP